MKKIMLFLFSLFLLSTASFAADLNLNATIGNCTPVNIPNPATEKACGDGYVGLMFKRTIVTCPGGKVTQSENYDTSQCVRKGSGQVDPCTINPTLCLSALKPPPCGVGRHWTTYWPKGDKKYAHCVADDPVCGWGTKLTYDDRAEPSCVPVVCPGNQVLQSNGQTCSCPANLPNWNGTTCSAPVCDVTVEAMYPPCPAGQAGELKYLNTIDCRGKLVNSIEVKNTCEAIPGCPSPSVGYMACPTGYKGQVMVTTTYQVVNNACVPTVTSDTSACTVDTTPQCPATTVTNGACMAGLVGNVKITTSYSVVNNACTPSTTEDSSGCYNPYHDNPNTCPGSSVSYGACPAGQNGQTVTTTSYTKVNDACVPSTTTDSSGCTTPATGGNTGCPADSLAVVACPSGQTGTSRVSTHYSNINGTCTPSTTIDNSNCSSPVVCPADSTVTGACPSGQLGYTLITTRYTNNNGTCTPSISTDSANCRTLLGSCPAGGPQNPPACACDAGTTWNGSACVTLTCPPGGPQNYPTCACGAGTTWNGSSCAVVQQQRKQLYCFGEAVGTPIPPGGIRATYGQYYAIDPNTDYLGGSIIGGGWEYIRANQGNFDTDMMLCSGSNGN